MKPKRPLFIITALPGVTIATPFAGDRPAKAKAEITTAKQTATKAKAKTEEVIPGADVQPAAYFYTGKPYDEDLGGYVFNCRTYSPAINRWTTPDPSRFPDGANAHRYTPVPTTEMDPFGLRTSLGKPQLPTDGDWSEPYIGTFSTNDTEYRNKLTYSTVFCLGADFRWHGRLSRCGY